LTPAEEAAPQGSGPGEDQIHEGEARRLLVIRVIVVVFVLGFPK